MRLSGLQLTNGYNDLQARFSANFETRISVILTSFNTNSNNDKPIRISAYERFLLSQRGSFPLKTCSFKCMIKF